MCNTILRNEKGIYFDYEEGEVVCFKKDEVVDSLLPTQNIEQLATLFSLLCGQNIKVEGLSTEAKLAIKRFLAQFKENAEKKVLLSHEQFNELLLLLNQYRVERPFFDFFFLKKDPREPAIEGETLFLDFRELKDGVKRFRGFAMLCFGNFRFAFRKLSGEKDSDRFMEMLDPWNRDSEKEREKFRKRQAPLTPLSGTKDEIEGDRTWLLGYLSAESLKVDHSTLMQMIEAGTDTEALKPLMNKLARLTEDQEEALKKGARNTVKYLTWDYLDVYVATSMREPWEFFETHELARRIFQEELEEMKGIRWFDPTQSSCGNVENVVDKGLLEGLMLKRAKCTIYLAQEGDTLGKDSELAATLAQGKPVIAYVPLLIGPSELKDHVTKLKERPLGYFRKRLLTLLADGFFDKPDNRAEVSHRAKILHLKMKPSDLKTKVAEILDLLSKFEEKRRFLVIGEEEDDFRCKHKAEIECWAKLLACVDSKAADNRYETIKNKHPLGMQVHLENGVANGVLLAREPKQCANLVRGILTRDLKFDIVMLKEEKKDKAFATALVESETKSRFRVVTEDECLTNSFWNFYFEAQDESSVRTES